MSGFESVGSGGKIVKGIWMWSRPIETVVVTDEGTENQVICLLLDCEGLDEDGKIF
jgi:hypothetical protein